MPKIWNDTIEGHLQAVQDAILDATAARVAERGLSAVTMSAIAEAAGISRATLYRYFSDTDAIVVAWHKRQVSRHLDLLGLVAARPADPASRLAAVLESYAMNAFGHRGHAAAPLLHQGEHIRHAHRHLHGFLTHLIADAQKAGGVRTDTDAGELAAYALAALEAAAGAQTNKAAIGRLVAIVLDGLKIARKSSRASASRSAAPGVRRGS